MPNGAPTCPRAANTQSTSPTRRSNAVRRMPSTRCAIWWREPFRGQSDHGRRHMDLSGDIPLRGGTKSCVGHAEQPLVEKEPRRDGRRREDRRRHGQRRPHACCGVPHAGYRLFLRAERLSPFLRGRPLLAAMGGIFRNGLPPEGRARRLQGGLHVARPLGQRAHGRLPNGCPTKRV